MRWLILLFVLVGCQQNPYEGRAGVQAPPPKRPEQKKLEPKGAFALEVPSLMAFTEGVRTEVEIKGAVPAGGEARFVMNGLPPGMVFDANTRKLTWTPDFQAANDPNDPTVATRLYTIEVRLSSSVDPIQSLTKTAILQVKDVPQPINIKSPLSVVGTEGQMLIQPIEFEDLEYPNGPFDAYLEGFPSAVGSSGRISGFRDSKLFGNLRLRQ